MLLIKEIIMIKHCLCISKCIKFCLSCIVRCCLILVSLFKILRSYSHGDSFDAGGPECAAQ